MKLLQLGARLGCHKRPDRSFFFFGRQFPLCARCTGVCAGQCVAILLWIVEENNIPLAVNVLFCLIMFFDWFVQERGLFESTNKRRFITGFFCGLGYVNILFIAVLLLKGGLMYM
jgi:uncharacterized membrane protein